MLLLVSTSVCDNDADSTAYKRSKNQNFRNAGLRRRNKSPRLGSLHAKEQFVRDLADNEQKLSRKWLGKDTNAGSRGYHVHNGRKITMTPRREEVRPRRAGRPHLRIGNK